MPPEASEDEVWIREIGFACETTQKRFKCLLHRGKVYEFFIVRFLSSLSNVQAALCSSLIIRRFCSPFDQNFQSKLCYFRKFSIDPEFLFVLHFFKITSTLPFVSFTNWLVLVAWLDVAFFKSVSIFKKIRKRILYKIIIIYIYILYKINYIWLNWIEDK